MAKPTLLLDAQAQHGAVGSEVLIRDIPGLSGIRPGNPILAGATSFARGSDQKERVACESCVQGTVCRNRFRSPSSPDGRVGLGVSRIRPALSHLDVETRRTGGHRRTGPCRPAQQATPPVPGRRVQAGDPSRRGVDLRNLHRCPGRRFARSDPDDRDKALLEAQSAVGVFVAGTEARDARRHCDPLVYVPMPTHGRYLHLGAGSIRATAQEALGKTVSQRWNGRLVVIKIARYSDQARAGIPTLQPAGAGEGAGRVGLGVPGVEHQAPARPDGGVTRGE